MPLGMRQMLPEAALATYDLIGFDPRGVGESSPVSCGLTPEEENWLRPYKEESFEKDVAWARGFADKCEKKAGDVLPHLTTRNTARDMDLLRAVLGEKKLSYVGYSYGTYLGAVYTQLFPRRADRFVLDSAVDPALTWRGMVQWWAWGAEPAFDRWTEWAAARSDTYDLGTTPKEVDRTFWELVARADEEPVVLDGQPLDGDTIRGGMRAAFFSPAYATEVVVELKKAAEGEPASAKKLAALTGQGRTAEDNMTASAFAVICGDNTAAWPRDPETYRREAIEDKGRYPLYGDFASSVKPCAFWGKSAEPATKVRNHVRSLVVQNEWDSQTPLPSGQALHSALKGSKMVTVAGGEGHGVYPSGNACYRWRRRAVPADRKAPRRGRHLPGDARVQRRGTREPAARHPPGLPAPRARPRPLLTPDTATGPAAPSTAGPVPVRTYACRQPARPGIWSYPSMACGEREAGPV